MTRIARAAIAACLALTVAATTAEAEFTPLPRPPGPSFSLFAVAGDAWVAASDYPFGAHVTRDGAATWQPAPLNGVTQPDRLGGLAAAPDRAFFLTVRDQSGWALLRMAPGAATFERVSAVLPASFASSVGAPAFDAKGRPWLGVVDQGRLTLARLADDGSLQDASSAPVANGSTPRIRFAGGKLYADIGAGVWQQAAGSLRQISGTGTKSFSSQFPVLALGRTVLTESGLSLDDGASFGDRFTRTLPVDGSDRLLAQDGRVLTRYAPGVYRPSGLLLPTGTGSLFQTKRGLLATGDGVLSLHAGPVPKLAVDGRGLSATARSMLARANVYRRQARLPPLLGDRLIAKASLSHARYWAGRALPRGHLLDVHGETPRTHGFTGTTPQERCRHAGGDCGGEVMNFGNQAEHPVDSWMATPYHRGPFLDPGGVAAGAARVGRIAVMDFSIEPRNLVVAPVRFPIGRYRGTLAFPGNEVPDPLLACRALHQPLGPAPSVPVSFVPPAAVTRPSVVQLFRGGARVPGCTRAGFFMGRAPLRPHTRYRVKATWYPSGGARPQTADWAFRTA